MMAQPYRQPVSTAQAALGASLASNAVIYTLANIASSAIPFLLLPLLTRMLTPHEYGLVTIFATLITAFSGIVGLSAHGAVNVRYFQPLGELPAYVGTALAIVAATAFAALVLTWIAAPWLSGWSDMPIAWLLLAVVAATAQAVILIRLILWQVRGEAARYGSFQVLQTALNLSLSLLLVVIGMGWTGRGAGIFSAMVLFAAIGLVSLRRTGLVAWRFNLAAARDVLRFGIPLVPHVVGGLCIAASDRLMVAHLTSVHDAGVYAAGLQIGLVIAILADAVVKALGPWLYARIGSADAAVKRGVVRITYLYFAAIAVVALLFGAAAPYLLLLVGESFRSSRDVVLYVALGGAFGGMYLMVVNYIFYARRNELLATASLTVGLLNLVASYVLIGRHGAVGAAQAYAVSQGLLFLVVWAIAARVHPMPWIEVLRQRTTRPVGV